MSFTTDYVTRDEDLMLARIAIYIMVVVTGFHGCIALSAVPTAIGGASLAGQAANTAHHWHDINCVIDEDGEIAIKKDSKKPIIDSRSREK